LFLGKVGAKYLIKQSLIQVRQILIFPNANTRHPLVIKVKNGIIFFFNFFF